MARFEKRQGRRLVWCNSETGSQSVRQDGADADDDVDIAFSQTSPSWPSVLADACGRRRPSSLAMPRHWAVTSSVVVVVVLITTILLTRLFKSPPPPQGHWQRRTVGLKLTLLSSCLFALCLAAVLHERKDPEVLRRVWFACWDSSSSFFFFFFPFSLLLSLSGLNVPTEFNKPTKKGEVAWYIHLKGHAAVFGISLWNAVPWGAQISG